jgi:molybdate transport system ATP-binding protein
VNFISFTLEKHFSFEVMISVKNIDVIKSGASLFQNFSWDVQENEHWVISGSNGSGKTMLLEALAGFVHHAHGEIYYDFITGDSWDERYAEKKKNITYIPAHALHHFIRDTHDLYYQQRYYDIGDEQRVLVKDVLGEDIGNLHALEIPSSLSIDHLLDLEIKRLSNGQLKKVLLLRHFLKGIPKLLLMDYPFEGLDHQSRKDLCAFVDFIATRLKVQIILVDHHHHLPSVINKKLTLENFRIKKYELFNKEGDTQTDERTSVVDFAVKNGNTDVVVMKDVQLQYGKHQLVKNFNWNVRQGDRWALVGRNGSGKTTLFSMIYADHPQAYAQKVYLFGKRRGTGESIWDIKKRISYLGPEQISYFNADVASSGKDYLRTMNQRLDEAVLEKAIDYFSAGDTMRKQVRFLSSGELQLLLIINCFLSEKELLLLDEPFQFLDQERKEKFTNYLHTHLTAETTLILITHYEEDMKQWTHSRMVLR